MRISLAQLQQIFDANGYSIEYDTQKGLFFSGDGCLTIDGHVSKALANDVDTKVSAIIGVPAKEGE